MTRSGPDLALLLLAGFRTMADRATVELARRGYDDIRPVHDFALHAILRGADTASELGRALSVTKQAAAKTIAALLREGEAIFEELRAQWEEQVGAESLESLADTLRVLVGDRTIRLDAPGWSAGDA